MLLKGGWRVGQKETSGKSVDHLVIHCPSPMQCGKGCFLRQKSLGLALKQNNSKAGNSLGKCR